MTKLMERLDTSAPRRPGVVLVVLSLAAFMASLDVFIVNVAFDDIGADFAVGECEPDFTPYLGKELSTAELCKLLGTWAAHFGAESG